MLINSGMEFDELESWSVSKEDDFVGFNDRVILLAKEKCDNRKVSFSRV